MTLVMKNLAVALLISCWISLHQDVAVWHKLPVTQDYLRKENLGKHQPGKSWIFFLGNYSCGIFLEPIMFSCGLY